MSMLTVIKSGIARLSKHGGVLEVEAVSSDWTYEDDFSGTNNWLKTGTLNAVNEVNNVLDWDGIRNGTVQATTLDLQSVGDMSDASDTAWLIRYKCLIDTVTGAPDNTDILCIGLSSILHTSSGNTNQDQIGIFGSLSDAAGVWYATESDAETIVANIQVFAHLLAIEIIYIQIIRLTATTFSVELFSDEYITSIEKENDTCESTTTGLRYIKVQNYAASTGTSQLDGRIDDLKYINNSTVPP